MKLVETSNGELKVRRPLGPTFRFTQLLPVLSSGLIVGLVGALLSISFGALIFVGPLAPFVASGIGLALAGTILTGLVIGFLSSLPGTVAGNQDVSSAILAVMAAGIVSTMPAGSSPREAFVTVVAAMALMAVLTGLFFFSLGYFRLGSLVRFLPYPVVGGFLAGTGWLLMVGAMGVMVDSLPPLAEIDTLFAADQLFRWLPGVLLGGAILFVLNRSSHSLAMPALVFGSIALFYLVMALRGLDPAALSEQGWLLGPFPSGRLWPVLSLAELSQIYWPAIGGQAINVAAIWLMSTVALLLNASGIELTSGREVDLDRELRAAGVGNVVSGLAGSLIGFHQLSLSVMNQKLGNDNRLTTLFIAGVCALVLFLGGSVLSLFPKMVLGGVLFFLGLSFVLEWAIHSRKSLPRGEYAIILLIWLVTALAGFIEAVGVGLLVAVILFVINYSRTDIVRDEFSGIHMQSRVTRRPAQAQLLETHGRQLHIMRLQGYIFFGTADRLLHRVRQQLQRPGELPLRYLLLDFRRVTGIDSTALLSFRRIRQLAENHNLTLVLTDVSPAIQRQLGEEATGPAMRLFPDLDHGCEWCEEQLLASLEGPESQTTQENPLRQELTRILGYQEIVDGLLAYAERREIAAGEYLIRQGDPPDALYFIESGRLTAQIETGDGEPARLQTMEGGHVLGELGFFLGRERTAAVIADRPSVVYCLSHQALARMKEQDPGLASCFHQSIVHFLAERVVHLVRVVNALE